VEEEGRSSVSQSQNKIVSGEGDNRLLGLARRFVSRFSPRTTNYRVLSYIKVYCTYLRLSKDQYHVRFVIAFNNKYIYIYEHFLIPH